MRSEEEQSWINYLLFQRLTHLLKELILKSKSSWISRKNSRILKTVIMITYNLFILILFCFFFCSAFLFLHWQFIKNKVQEFAGMGDIKVRKKSEEGKNNIATWFHAYCGYFYYRQHTSYNCIRNNNCNLWLNDCRYNVFFCLVVSFYFSFNFLFIRMWIILVT